MGLFSETMGGKVKWNGFIYVKSGKVKKERFHLCQVRQGKKGTVSIMSSQAR